MSTATVPLQGQTVQADTSATPNTIPMRDSAGGILAAVVQGSTLLTTGNYQGSVVQKTANATLDNTGDIWEFDTVSGVMTATLPAATSGNKGVKYEIWNVSSGTIHTLTIANVTGVTSLASNNTKVTVHSNGTTWFSA